MAVKINIALTKSGINIPTGTLIKPNTHFPPDVKLYDENGDFEDYEQFVTMDLPIFASIAEYLKEGSLGLGMVDEFPPAFEKTITKAEAIQMMADGAIVEVWLKDWLESILGADTCEILNPYPA